MVWADGRLSRGHVESAITGKNILKNLHEKCSTVTATNLQSVTLNEQMWWGSGSGEVECCGIWYDICNNISRSKTYAERAHFWHRRSIDFRNVQVLHGHGFLLLPP